MKYTGRGTTCCAPTIISTSRLLQSAVSAVTGTTSDLTGTTSDLTGATSELTGATSELTGTTSDLTGATSVVMLPGQFLHLG
ncbi:hypothetical protein LC608_12350 [Nostoc sp. XA010]|uniref:hypothetical protein n=1 Tax=Nostoc sp. XA010 TaxID=2780407 RepID=UPI001E3E2239|nr:hypothetical protein [Nostoc sp. XA010]MCC5657769.1 hypothetical protein [Nostoc sp. XA010]